MKEERIGKTPRDELKWVLRILYPGSPLTEGDKLNLIQHDLMLFAMDSLAPVPLQSDKYLNETLALLKTMVNKAIAHEPITEIPRPYAPRLSWDMQIRRYKLDEAKQSEFFETRVAGRLGELILNHGHLLKECKAPAKMKPGPKPKNAPVEETGAVCGKRFLAIKETQLYCSPACLDRALSRKKAKKVMKATRRRKKATQRMNRQSMK